MLIWLEDDSVSVGLDSCLWVVGKGSGEEQRKNILQLQGPITNTMVFYCV